MNKRRIAARLAKVHSDWVESINDKDVQSLAKKNSIITGGCIASLLLNEEPKDYDIYFRDKETTFAVSKYYVDIFNTKMGCTSAVVLTGSEYEEEKAKQCDSEDTPFWLEREAYNMNPERVRIFIKSSGVLRGESTVDKKKKPEPYRPVFLSSNAVTLSDKIQLINRFYGEAENIHESFDFLHCFNYWDSKTKQLTLNVDSLEAILDKRLVYKGSHYPLCSIIRLRKFLKKGWTVNAGQIFKACFQLSRLDLTNLAVLEDQLIGVDSAYFANLIRRIQSEIDRDSDLRIDEAYVMLLVDEIFG